ncbi:hypothetical protein EV356DRAFT_509259 [Viridothelium virens]|uniref:Rhodopsin domain-containing protein n=1 Tax=Viridothelium virens TaxID=1048519 RepID=A0A6A6GX89_VIRVR|nr:hypothetical protein EV356DRAFT_509259 [Viridothelium virens]
MTDAQLQRIIIAQAIISIISDFLLALFPIVILWKVQISTRIKAGLCTLMALGIITGALCIVRTVLNWQTINDDATWESIPNWHFRTWEVCIGIITASIPCLRPGYRVVTSSLSTYYSLRSSPSRRALSQPEGRPRPSEQSDYAHDMEEKANLARKLTFPGQAAQYYPARHAAAHVASVEADRAAEVGAGDETFPLQGIRGDVNTMEQGKIKKTTWFGTDSDARLSRDWDGTRVTGE